MKWYKHSISGLSDEEYLRWYLLLDKSRKRRVDKFCFDDDKKRTVSGEMLVRCAVADMCKVAQEDIVIKENDNGKPYIENVDIEFNISHSCDVVVCAVSDRKVGIDVEKIRAVKLSVAKRVCSEKELEYIFGRVPVESDFALCDDEEILTRFFTLWTKKEAYAKCTGKGLSGGLMVTPECETIYDDGYVISVYTE